MANLIEKIKKNTGSFCEWLVMDLGIALLPIIIKYIFSTISGLVDIYSELFFVALLLSAGTLKYLYKLRQKENVEDPIFWISILVLIIAAAAYGFLTVFSLTNAANGINNAANGMNNATNGNKIFAALLISDFSSVLMSLLVWYKSIGS